MRLFPRARRRRVVVASVVASVALGAAVIPLAYAGDGPKHPTTGQLKHRQQQVHAQLGTAGHDLDESSAQLRTTTAALTTAQAGLVSAKADLAVARTKLADARATDLQLAKALSQAQATVTTARADLRAGEQALSDQRQTVVDTVVGYVQDGDPTLRAYGALLDAQTPEDLIRGMEIRDTIVGTQDQVYADLHAAEVQLQDRKDRLADARDAVGVRRAAAAAHLQTVQALHLDAVDAKVHVRDLVTSRRDAKQAAVAARAHDIVVLKQLRKEQAAIKAKIVAAARAAALRGGGYTGSVDGLLLAPVTGPVTSPFGYRIHPIYGYWGLHDGTDFGVSCGEGMRAAGDGTVISQYYSDVYGNRLYVNLGQVNGKNITVVYNHATSYRVSVGDHVKRGEIVGYVGSTGWSTGCHLHFTVLENGTAVDPMTYL